MVLAEALEDVNRTRSDRRLEGLRPRIGNAVADLELLRRLFEALHRFFAD